MHPHPAVQVSFEVDDKRRVLRLLHFVMRCVQIIKPALISDGHKDAGWLKQLKQFLALLEDRDLIRVWNGNEIRPRQDCLAEIKQALATARAAQFPVNQLFLSSPFIRKNELPALLLAAPVRGCLILQLAVGTSTFGDSALAKIQGATPPHRPLDLQPEAEQNEVLSRPAIS